MAQTIVTLCDRCLADDVEAAGFTYGPFMADGKPRTVDLCKVCYAELVEPLVAVVVEWGAVDSKPPKRRGPKEPRPLPTLDVAAEYPCPWCGADYTSGSGLRGHTAARHGGSIDSLVTTCPECAAEFKRVGRHTRETHGRTLAESLAWARDNGDPHGVWAALTHTR